MTMFMAIREGAVWHGPLGLYAYLETAVLASIESCLISQTPEGLPPHRVNVWPVDLDTIVAANDQSALTVCAFGENDILLIDSGATWNSTLPQCGDMQEWLRGFPHPKVVPPAPVPMPGSGGKVIQEPYRLRPTPTSQESE